MQRAMDARKHREQVALLRVGEGTKHRRSSVTSFSVDFTGLSNAECEQLVAAAAAADADAAAAPGPLALKMCSPTGAPLQDALDREFGGPAVSLSQSAPPSPSAAISPSMMQQMQAQLLYPGGRSPTTGGPTPPPPSYFSRRAAMADSRHEHSDLAKRPSQSNLGRQEHSDVTKRPSQCSISGAANNVGESPRPGVAGGAVWGPRAGAGGVTLAGSSRDSLDSFKAAHGLKSMQSMRAPEFGSRRASVDSPSKGASSCKSTPNISMLVTDVGQKVQLLGHQSNSIGPRQLRQQMVVAVPVSSSSSGAAQKSPASPSKVNVLLQQLKGLMRGPAPPVRQPSVEVADEGDDMDYSKYTATGRKSSVANGPLRRRASVVIDERLMGGGGSGAGDGSGDAGAAAAAAGGSHNNSNHSGSSRQTLETVPSFGNRKRRGSSVII